MNKINQYIVENIKPNVEVGKEPTLDDEEARVLFDKSDVISENYVFWKKSKQIRITKAFENTNNPIDELNYFLEKILITSVPVKISVSVDFFGLWNSSDDKPDLGFVWASKPTSLIKDFDANTREEIDKIKNSFHIDFLYEDWVNTHLETILCQNSKVHAHCITNALIILSLAEFG